MTLTKTLKLIKKNRVSKLTFTIEQARALIYIKMVKTFSQNQNEMCKDYCYEFSTAKKSILKQNLISCIIKVNMTKTNTFLNVTNSKGDLKLSLSLGKLKLKKRQRATQPNTLVQLFKKMFLKARFLEGKTVGLQFQNVRPFNELFVIKTLKNKVFIKSLRSYNLYPHNGCRPKKLRRFKRRTKK